MPDAASSMSANLQDYVRRAAQDGDDPACVVLLALAWKVSEWPAVSRRILCAVPDGATTLPALATPYRPGTT